MRKIRSKSVIMFVGPSSYGLIGFKDLICDIDVQPPIKRNVLPGIIQNNKKPGVLILVDGTFYSYPSVAHKEIKDAIDAGWEVWGLSSMGAIRASEMDKIGMNGYGFVYAYFKHFKDGRDDEVALLHGDEEPFFPISEPLLNIKFGLKALLKNGIITKKINRDIINQLSSIWFGYRTLDYLSQLLIQSGIQENYFRDWINEFDNYRIKNLDLKYFLETRPWK